MEWIKNTGTEPAVPEGGKLFVRMVDEVRQGHVPEGHQIRSMDYRWRWERISHDSDIDQYRIELAEPVKTLEADPAYKDTNPKDAIGIRKAPMSVLSMAVLAEVGVGVLEGASKYGRHNWRGAGIRESVYFDATMRHLMAYWEGQDIDPDSQLSHLTKAICSLMVWRDAQIQGMATDDRPPRSADFYPALNTLAGNLVDKHADKKPHHWTLADFE